jgi:hypothetical protein
VRALILLLVCWCTVCCCTFVASPASAQKVDVDAARAAEAAAREAFRKGDFTVAAEGFAAAFRLDPKANTKYNEALAWSKADAPAAAADAYEAALSFGGLDEKLRKKGTDALASLKNKVGRLVVDEPLGATITVAHAQERGVPVKVHLSPGKHEVTAKLADGSEQKKTVSIVAGSDTRIAFEGSSDAPVPTPDPTPAPSPKRKDDGDTGLLIAGWTLLGVGAAGLVAMGVFGGLTLSKVSKYDDTGNTDFELHDEAVTLKTTTNVLLAAGGGVAAVGVVLLIVGTVGGDDEGAAFTPTANGFRIRF